MEGMTLEVLSSTDKIYRIEVGTRGEHLHIFCIVLVNLAALKNLRTKGAILIESQEGATAGLTNILHDTTNTHWPIEFFLQVDYQVRIFKLLDILPTTAKITLNEMNDLLKFLMVVAPRLQVFQVIESFLLSLYEYAGNNFLPLDSISFQTVWDDIVDILDEDDISVDFIEVLNQCTVTSRTEEQRTIFVAERCVVGVGCNCICTWLLLREADFQFNVELLLIISLLLFHLLLKEFQVVMRDSEMNQSLSFRTGI